MMALDLFSGIGGFSLGLERAGMHTVAFCEIDPYCRRVLAKHWPHTPIHEDIRKLAADAVGPVDLICGGYPCQPFSVAGKRGGEKDDRHLWPEMARLVDECRPAWVLGENVAGHISMGLDEVLSDLEGMDYAARAFVIPAAAVDAHHRRDRVWVVAHSNRSGQSVSSVNGDAGCGELGAVAHSDTGQRKWTDDKIRAGWNAADDGGEAVSNTNRKYVQGQQRERDDAQNRGEQRERQIRFCGGEGGWLAEPNVGRVAHGVPKRVDRLRALGNAVVPQVVEVIGRAIIASSKGGWQRRA